MKYHIKCVLCGVHGGQFPPRRFHRFPLDPEKSDKWAAVTGKKWIISASVAGRYSRFRVCSHHFKDVDYLTKLKTRLHPDAIPTSNQDFTAIECSKQYADILDYYSDSYIRQRKIQQKSFETSKERAKLYPREESTEDIDIKIEENIDIKIEEDIDIKIEENISSDIEEDVGSDSETEDIEHEQTMLANSNTVKDIGDFDECNNAQNKELSKENEMDNECGCKKKNLEDSVQPKKITKRSSYSKEQLQLSQQQSLSEDEDEMDLFFSSMLKKVKQLPKYDQVQLRMQICTLVGNAELKYWSSQEKLNVYLQQ